MIDATIAFVLCFASFFAGLLTTLAIIALPLLLKRDCCKEEDEEPYGDISVGRASEPIKSGDAVTFDPDTGTYRPIRNGDKQ